MQTLRRRLSHSAGVEAVVLLGGRARARSHSKHAALGHQRHSGQAAWGRAGVAVSQMGDLPATLYDGELLRQQLRRRSSRRSTTTCRRSGRSASSGEFARAVRGIDHVAEGARTRRLSKVPFDIDHWRRVAEEAGPLPEPWSDDPTQWLFEGRPEVSTEPLQVAVGRLLGYRWPEQPESDDLTELADRDGIVCLPSVLGERPAAERLQELLARAYGATWSPARTRELLAASGSKKTDLDSWLRDEFFKAHCQVFKNRPFVWHIWDGRKDGFSALVNYHRLDGGTLRRLAYTYLGDWIERQDGCRPRTGLPGPRRASLAARISSAVSR